MLLLLLMITAASGRSTFFWEIAVDLRSYCCRGQRQIARSAAEPACVCTGRDEQSESVVGTRHTAGTSCFWSLAPWPLALRRCGVAAASKRTDYGLRRIGAVCGSIFREAPYINNMAGAGGLCFAANELLPSWLLLHDAGVQGKPAASPGAITLSLILYAIHWSRTPTGNRGSRSLGNKRREAGARNKKEKEQASRVVNATRSYGVYHHASNVFCHSVALGGGFGLRRALDNHGA